MKKVFFLIFSIYSFITYAEQSLSDSNVLLKVKINHIFIVGNKKTHPNIILRELSIVKGEYYTLKHIKAKTEEDRQKIYNTNLFNEVEVQVLETSESEVEILIEVDERWYFFPAPILYLADRNLTDLIKNRDNRINRINYGLKIDQFNLRGKNEKLRFIGQIGFETKLLLRYKIPYIDKNQKNGLAFQFSFNERERMPYISKDHVEVFTKKGQINRRTWSGGLIYSYRPSFYNFHHIQLFFRSGQISDTVAIINPNFYGEGKKEQQIFQLKYTYEKDYRNKRVFATRGYYLNLSVEKIGLGIFKEVNIFSLQGTYTKYIDLGKGFYLANSIIGELSFPNKQPYFNYRGLGYYEIFVRGFEANVIEGPKYVLGRNSFRKQLININKDWGNLVSIKQFSKFKLDIYGKLFADYGYVKNYPSYEISSRLADKMIWSVGFGLDVVLIYDFVLRFEYSYNAANQLNFAFNIKADM